MEQHTHVKGEEYG